jgi:hypothetical protein
MYGKVLLSFVQYVVEDPRLRQRDKRGLRERAWQWTTEAGQGRGGNVHGCCFNAVFEERGM